MSVRGGCLWRKAAGLVLAATALTITATSLGAQETDKFRDTKLSFEERARDLVSRMTLEEKVSQLGHTADAIKRLGIPEYNWWNEGLHGVARAGIATVFPQAIGLAATFDDALIRRDADVISTEFRAKYNVGRGPDGSSEWYHGLTPWSPNINIFRDPRWGRGQETYGEDPYLTARMGVAFVGGLQGDDPRYLKVVSTPKHFAVHSGPEATRHEVDVEASRHDMADTYLPAFRAAVVEGHADSVMCAYNSLNGEPACANHVLLDEYLRGAWKFGGYVVSDCGAIEDVSAHHHFEPTMEEGVAAALKAGTDLICGEPPQDRVHLERTAAINAVKQGLLAETDIDRAVTRLMTARLRLGMFDPAAMVPWSKLGAAANDTPAHRKLALQTAQESLVLLKNEHQLLPLKKGYAKIAVIGPDADSLDALEGNYNGTPSAPVTILAGIRARFSQSQVRFVAGTGLVGTVVRPVPGARLYTSAAKSAHGLTAEYFDSTDLTGEPVLRRVDPSINFSWGFNGVSPRLKKNYSVRWMGVLTPAASADYVLGFTGQDGYRLWVDGQLLVEDWTRHRPSTTLTKAIHLDQGHPYALKIEYFQSVRGAEAKLVWGVPGREEQAAVSAARSADLVVMVLGLSARIEGEQMKVAAEGFAGGDRTSIDLPGPQERLLEAVSATGKPLVLVLTSGSALAVNWADAHVPAILQAWYPGEAGGTAVAGALAGDFSPAGRLPVTFYKSVAELPPFDSYAMKGRTYRYFTGAPLYPFGYGLSYTSFRYGKARATVAKDGGVRISAQITNAGDIASDEVAQVYLTHRGVDQAALRELKGFRRVHLEPHATKAVEFALSTRDVSVVDASGARKIVPGDVEVWIGGGQPGVRPGSTQPPGANTSFHLDDATTLPD
jgi:beta-glucosidase